MKSITLATLLLVAQAAAAPARRNYKQLVVFGDSISDNGNVYGLTDQMWPEDPSYYKGRFSNGPVWCEQLADHLSLDLKDFAYGSGTADNSLVAGFTGATETIPVPSVDEQIDLYLEEGHNQLKSSIAVIMVGLNDKYFDPDISATTVAARIQASSDRLASLGAKNILIGIEYDLARVPYYSLEANIIPAQNISMAAEYSAALGYELRTFVAAQSSRPSLFWMLNKYGFNAETIKDSCLVGESEDTPRSLCKKPDEYLWFDTFHLTEAGHTLLADEAKRVIKTSFW